MRQKNRRKWPPERKLRIVLEALQSDTKLAEICRRERMAPNQVYQRRKQLLGSAQAVFARKPTDGQADPRVAKLAVDNQRMKDVIVEITAENLVLKKTLSD